jgi:acyl dehydratase
MLADDIRAMPPHVTDWFTMDADRVRAFAEVTQHRQDINLDEARAAQSRFGGTIVQGFLTLSMLSAMSQQVTQAISDMQTSVNYGFDRVRFVAPVRVGSRLRGRFSVAHVDEGAGWLGVHWDVEVEIEGQERPALVANWITRVFLS